MTSTERHEVPEARFAVGDKVFIIAGKQQDGIQSTDGPHTVVSINQFNGELTLDGTFRTFRANGQVIRANWSSHRWLLMANDPATIEAVRLIQREREAARA